MHKFVYDNSSLVSLIKSFLIDVREVLITRFSLSFLSLLSFRIHFYHVTLPAILSCDVISFHTFMQCFFLFGRFFR